MQSKWCPIKRIRHEVPRNDNKMQSKWKRKVANRTILKSERKKQTNKLAQDWIETKMAESSPEAYSDNLIGSVDNAAPELEASHVQVGDG